MPREDLTSTNKQTDGLLQKVSLRFILIVPLVLQITLALGITGYLSFRNGQRAVNKLAGKLLSETTARVKEHIDRQLTKSHLVNQINMEIISFELLNTEELSALGSHFWRQLQIFESIGVIYFGTEQGTFIAAQRGANGSFFFVKREEPPAAAKVYRANEQGELTEFKKVIPDFIDIRQRPWYVAAKKQGSLTWGNIFALQVSPQIDLPASVPFIDDEGNLKGVLGNNLSLEAISKFLQQTKVGKSGHTFIIERNGKLVASSTLIQPFLIKEDGTTQRIMVSDSEDPLLRTTSQYLLEKFGNFKQIETSKQLDFSIDRQQYFSQILPYQDEWGIDWLIVVVVPKSDFMAEIYANTNTTIFLYLIALILATIVGCITTGWVSEPLLRLNESAKKIAQGNWQKTIVTEPILEITELTNSFNWMTKRLQNSFTELHSLNQDLSESETRLTQFLEALPVGVAIHDHQGELTYLNQIGENLLGVEGLAPIKIEQLTELFKFYQAKTQLLYPTENLPIVRALQGETVKTDDIEIRLEQEVIALEILATPIFNHQGRVAYAISTFQDISNRKQAEEQLIYNALHDNLTSLPNRNFLLKRLEIIIKRAKRYPEYQFAVLFLDLDRFKVINDSLGHLVGDHLLIDVSQKLQSIIRETDLAARLGGDEFVIVLEEITGIQDAIQVSERIFTELRFPFFLEGKEVVVSTSIGIVLGTKDYLEPSEILRDADAAMYQAKAQGKAKYQIFNAEMHSQSLRRLHLENDLAKAIQEQEFILPSRNLLCSLF